MNSIGIGIAGLGTVGAEVAKQLIKNKNYLEKKSGTELNLVAVSARNKSLDRGIDLKNIDWIDDAENIFNHKKVNLVVELIGGSEGVPLNLCKNTLQNGKSIVTANKAMLSAHGYDLAKIAEEKKVSIAYEAAVAGCIPIIRSLRDGLSGTRIKSISGILNGTCNYILSAMREDGRAFADVLKEAQKLGYAEADPTFDIDGIDAAQKLSILSAIAFGTSPDIVNLNCTGIKDVDVTDIAIAEQLGYRIKLLAVSKLYGDGLVQQVSPCMISKDKQMSSVEGVLNAVEVDTELAGSIMLTGFGAGAKPTATAVLSDIVNIAQNNAPPAFGSDHKDLIKSLGVGTQESHRYYIRINVIDKSGVLANITEIFRKNKLSIESLLQRGRDPNEEVPVVITTHETSELTLNSVMNELELSKELLVKPVSMKII